MNVDFLDCRDRRVGAIWRSLERTNTCFFLSWEWIEHWLDTLPRSHHPVLAILRTDEAALAAAMVGRRLVARHRLVPSRTWFLNATGDAAYDELHTEHNALVGTRVPLGELVHALPRGWDELALPAVGGEAFGELQVQGVRVHVDREVTSPHVDLQRVRTEGYAALVASRTRTTLLRSRSELGELELELGDSVPHALDIFGELVSLHQRARLGQDQPGVFGDPWFESFHRCLIAHHLRHVDLVRVRAANRTVGCLYGFRYRGRVVSYLAGFGSYEDPDLDAELVSQALAIEHAAGRGDASYVFAGGGTHRLSSGATRLRWLRVQRPLVRFALADQLRAWKLALER
jgi:hypothetical protein